MIARTVVGLAALILAFAIALSHPITYENGATSVPTATVATL
jgi:hypothetical protein